MRTFPCWLCAFLCAFLFLPVAALAAADTALLATVSFYPDGSATIDDLQVTFAGIDQQSPLHLADGIRLVADGGTVYSSSVPVTFRLLSDPPRKMPTMTVTQHLPYPGNRGMLEVVRGGNVAASFDLRGLCDNDGFCRGFENGISCPADCEIRVPDTVCMPYPDGACDPDCAAGLDSDCLNKPVPVAETGSYLPLLFLGIVLLSILTLWLLKMPRR